MGGDLLDQRVLLQLVEAHLAVVAAGGQRLVVRVEGHGVHEGGVREVPRRGVGGHFPDLHRLVGGGGVERDVVGRHGDVGGGAAVLEDLADAPELLRHRPARQGDVPGQHRLVLAGAGQEKVAGAEGQAVDLRRRLDGGQLLGVVEVPHAHRAVVPTGGDQGVVLRGSDAAHRRRHAGELSLHGAAGQVPHLDALVVGGGQDVGAGLQHGQAAHRRADCRRWP